MITWNIYIFVSVYIKAYYDSVNLIRYIALFWTMALHIILVSKDERIYKHVNVVSGFFLYNIVAIYEF